LEDIKVGWFIRDKEGIQTDFEVARPIRRDNDYIFNKDPFHKPLPNRIYYRLVGNQLECNAGPGAVGIEAKIEYVKYPQSILIVSTTQDSELSIDARGEICEVAVRKYLERTENPRYVSYAQDNQFKIQ